jgi:hypothetical protein
MKKTSGLTGGENVNEFLASLGDVAGAHPTARPPDEELAMLRPAWSRLR